MVAKKGLAVVPVNYVAFIRTLLWPTDLAVYYPHPHDTMPWWQPFGAALLLVVVTLVVIVLRRRRYLPVGWFWFLGTLVPVIGIVQLASHARTDHYVYMPSIGLFMMVAWGVAGLCSGEIQLGPDVRRARGSAPAARQLVDDEQSAPADAVFPVRHDADGRRVALV